MVAVVARKVLASAMSDEAFTFLMLLIVTGAYALAGVIYMVAVIVQAIRSKDSP